MRAPSLPIDSERFERCFQRNYAHIARYCARRAATPDEAEDAATEVFATAWRRRHDLPGEPDDRLWLFGVARRVLANSARAEHRRRRLVQRLTAQPAPAPIPPPSAGGEATALARALAALSEGDRELLLLTGWEELTPAQIARVLDRPAAIVSRRLHRARRRFAAALERSPVAERSATAPVCDLMESE
jgi:RNA polymerase sigma factor (sigma-70 family)